MHPGKLILILGPSGSGKGVVIQILKERHHDYIFPLSCTTRAPRPMEKDGEVYHFILEEEFERRMKQGDFLEWAKVHNEHRYGTLKQPIEDAITHGKILVREVDVQGMRSLKKIIPSGQLVTIFLTTPSWEVLRERIQRRHQESDEELRRREQSYRKEMQDAQNCDYIVHSLEGKIQEMVDEIEKIIEKETQDMR